MDTQFEQTAEDRRRHITVALQLYDHDVVHRTAGVSRNVMEPQVRVDGETLGLALVHQGDTVEAVLQLTGKRRRVVLQPGTDEIIVGHVFSVLTTETDVVPGIHRVELLHRHAFLLRTAVVVLGLHLTVNPITLSLISFCRSF